MSSLPLCDERRRFSRIIYQTPGMLSDHADHWPVVIEDLSLKGCMLKVPESWHGVRGRNYQLTFSLHESANIAMGLIMAHASPGISGFQCIHIDLDSICELRRLVELNLGNSQVLERDLRALAAKP